VKTQLWIGVSVYLLVAIIKNRLHLDASLHTRLQILAVTVFEKIPLVQARTPRCSIRNRAYPTAK
jgi:hypothetical protein